MNSYYFPKLIFKILRLVKAPETKWKLMQKFPKLMFYPHMESSEYRLFKELCQNKTVFLEYGSGGSTIYLLKQHKTVFSVESNPAFYQYMCSINLVKKALNKNIFYKFVNLGPTNKWGKPMSEENSHHWPEYYEEIWKQINPELHKVDVVFIDGRFRVCCCLYSILKATEYGWRDIVFIIHDFWRRKKYHVILEFLDEIKSQDNLVSFRIRKNIDMERLIALLDQHSMATV